MSLVTMHLVTIGSILGYVFVAGFAWSLLDGLSPKTKSDTPAREFGTGFWPITLVCWIVWQVATAGPRIVAWWRREWQRPQLPKAEIVRPRD